MNTNNVHEGRNIKRFREMLGMKQEALAIELGGDWTQRRVSLLEQKDQIERDILEEIARALKMPVEAFENMTDDSAINIIANTITNNDSAAVLNHYPTFNVNPIEKWLETLEENKKLYERMLKEKDEAIERFDEILKQLLNKK